MEKSFMSKMKKNVDEFKKVSTEETQVVYHPISSESNDNIKKWTYF